MATISGYDSSSIGVLFSSLNSGSTKTSAMFGTSDLLGISYSDYATIQNGSYTKLMKAYYTKEASGDSSSSSVSATTSTSKDSSKTLANIESAAEDLKKASETLRTNGDKSLQRNRRQIKMEKYLMSMIQIRFTRRSVILWTATIRC